MVDETTEPAATEPTTEPDAVVTPPATEPEPEPEPKPEHEVPLPCGHWVSTYEHEGKDYCGVCGVEIPPAEAPQT
jgi:hypothetical protein